MFPARGMWLILGVFVAAILFGASEVGLRLGRRAESRTATVQRLPTSSASTSTSSNTLMFVKTLINSRRLGNKPHACRMNFGPGPSLTTRAPWVVALMFGLMHGLGFASGLKDAGLPDGHIPTALLFFSIGVETGHFLFIGFVLSLIAVMLRAASRLTSMSQQRFAILEVLPTYAIGGVACFGSFNVSPPSDADRHSAHSR
jgi:hypothetical protein